MSAPTPLILAVETAGDAGSVALVDATTIVAQSPFPTGARGGSALAPAVAAVLAAAGGSAVVMPRLTAIAVGIGPGSYTGARIGVVYAKTFAFARRLPVFGVCGLAAVAHRVARGAAPGAPDGRGSGGGSAASPLTWAVSLPAHDGRLYAAIYRCIGDTEPEIVVAPMLVDRAAWDVLVAAPGVQRVDIPPERVAAADIGRVAVLRQQHGSAGKDGGAHDAAALEPLYLQLAAPERAPTP